MQKITYDYIAAMEENHWWYNARKKIIEMIINRFVKECTHTTAIIGCGSGATFSIWQKISTEVWGIDIAEEAIMYARAKPFTQLLLDDAQTLSTLPENYFTIAALFDVLEHVGDEAAALNAIKKVLKNEGLLFLTVPAKKYLWGGADILSLHKRRYNKKELVKTIETEGFEVCYCTYFNSLLFIPIFLVRLGERIFHLRPDIEYKMPGKVINALLYYIFILEKYLLRIIRLPIGASLLLIAQVKK